MKTIELGHVVLYVIHLTRSADFYRDTLGFPEIARTDTMALFSGGRTHHELLLIEIGGKRELPSYPKAGLYHIGFKIGDSHDDLVRAYHELQKKGVGGLGAVDHTVTHSLYLLDPDGNELELYVDVTELWKKDKNLILSPPKPLRLE